MFLFQRGEDQKMLWAQCVGGGSDLDLFLGFQQLLILTLHSFLNDFFTGGVARFGHSVLAQSSWILKEIYFGKNRRLSFTSNLLKNTDAVNEPNWVLNWHKFEQTCLI